MAAAPPRAQRAVALVVFALLACVHTWPLARNPARFSRIDNGDALLNMWAVAWVGHQLPRDPRHLFDANIFYPERLTLAYSEGMIVQGVLGTPIIAAGGSPVLTFNIVLLSGLAATGWAFCVLVQRWTGSWAAGYTSGSLAAFNAHALVRLVHLQTQHVEFIALMLFALDRVIVSRRVRDAVWLGVGFALQALTSVYLLVFSVWMLIFAVLTRIREVVQTPLRRSIGLLALAGTVATALLVPYLVVYYTLHQRAGFERAVSDNQLYAASWLNYLSTGSRVHYGLWSARFTDVSSSATFPGFAAIALVGLACAWPETRRDSRVRMCAGAAIGCALVSFAPATPIFPLLYAAIPLFRVVRVEAHLGQIVLLMLAVIAGFGIAGLGRRLQAARMWPIVAAALCAIVNLEAVRAPLGYRVFTGIPAIYDVLAHAPAAVAVELPFPPPVGFFGNAGYMLNSTSHWRPILNGYSGFKPAWYGEVYAALRGFPDMTALTMLHERGVTHVVVHADAFSAAFGVDRLESIDHAASLQNVARDGDIRIYRLR